VSNPHASQFIRDCLQQKDGRPTASQLLGATFFQVNEAEDYEEVRTKFSPLQTVEVAPFY